MDKITLTGMTFYGFHGVCPEENVIGQKFIVDVTLFLDLDKSGKMDDINSTVNYCEVYEICRSIMEGEAKHLIERTAWLINDTILSAEPLVEKVVTTVHKPGAPIQGIFRDVSVTLERTRK